MWFERKKKKKKDYQHSPLGLCFLIIYQPPTYLLASKNGFKKSKRMVGKKGNEKKKYNLLCLLPKSFMWVLHHPFKTKQKGKNLYCHTHTHPSISLLSLAFLHFHSSLPHTYLFLDIYWSMKMKFQKHPIYDLSSPFYSSKHTPIMQLTLPFHLINSSLLWF